MENKEKKVRGRERAQGAVIGAGVTQAIFAVINVVSGGRVRDILSFAVFGLVSLALAVFFVMFKHPAWGILNTVLYAVGRVLSTMGLLLVYTATKETLILAGLTVGAGIAIAFLAFFIYADYQAFKLRQLALGAEESE